MIVRRLNNENKNNGVITMSKRITDVDVNFRTNDNIPSDTVWKEAYDGNFEINGLYKPEELKKYTRLPDSFKTDLSVNEGVRALIHHTAGGRIRFSTNSPYVAVMTEVSDVDNGLFLTSCGQSGMDFYMCRKGSSDYQYKKSFAPPPINSDKDRFYSGIAYFKDYDLSGQKEFEVMLHLPLYNGVNSVKIGLMPGCSIDVPVEYNIKSPICFYGASITQGGCASRPGNNYPNHLSRLLNADFINLGFSGSAQGEFALADYIADMEISALITDLDMCINDIEIFRKTHYPFYERIRSRNKALPIIFMSIAKFPKINITSNQFRNYYASRDIIKQTVEKGIASGDSRIYYIEGEELFGDSCQDCCTVDSSHPNDLGFFRMAQGILPTLKKALSIYN